MQNNAKISLITVTYNDSKHLKLTLESILQQSYKNYECIVIDGGSKDGTVKVIKDFEKKFEGKLKWVSEPDNGIFDAINKGYKMSSGSLVGIQFDLFADENALSIIAKHAFNPTVDGIHGDLVYIKGKRIVRYWNSSNGHIRSGWSAAHPTLYLKRYVYEKYGLYKTDYKCASDYEFEVRIFKDSKLNIKYIPKVLVKMFYGGTSTGGIKAYWQSFVEGHRALKENNIKNAWIIDICRCTRVLLQFISKNKNKDRGNK